MKIYEITWYDAHFNGGSFYEEDLERVTQPYIMRTLGYYVGESKIDFKIAQEFHDEGKRFGHIMSIPHKVIIKKRLLKGGR